MNAWLREHVTVPNLALFLGAAIGLGGYIRSFEALEMRVAQVEASLQQASHEAANTYLRRDVQDAVLRSIDQRLATIEESVREIKAQHARE